MKPMTDITFHPEPLTDAVEPIGLVDKLEGHDVPFGNLAIDLLEDRALRETLARFYEPSYRDRYDDDDRGAPNLLRLFYQSFPEGLHRRFSEVRLKENPPVKFSVRIILDYPLTNPWYADVCISSARLGEIFGIAYDMYCYIYDLDNADWQKIGHQDSVPRRSEKSLNRAKGNYVWGHDMSDLVFESVEFQLNADWPWLPGEEYPDTDISKEELAVAYAKAKGEEPKESDVMTVKNRRSKPYPAPLGHESVDPKMPIGVITFGVGS